MAASDFLARINHIVGCDVSKSDSTIRLNWNNYDEGRALIQRLRVMQKELQLLKQEIGATVTAIKSEFTTARTKVGKSFGAGLAAGFFGRKTMGRANASHRDSLRRGQMQAVAPYETLKGTIDRLLAVLDQLKGQIEVSPAYKIRTATLPKKAVVVPSTPLLPPPTPELAPPTHRYFAFLNDDVKGPYSVEQLMALKDAGTLTEQTQICPEGTEDWNTASAFKI